MGRAAVWLVLALTAAGCGGGGDHPPGTSVRTVPTTPGATKLVAMPDVVGAALPDAASRLRGLGFALNVTGPPGGPPVRGDRWTVCRTAPPAGITLPSITRVELVVARPGRCRS